MPSRYFLITLLCLSLFQPVYASDRNDTILYNSATALLVKGQDFEKAAALLENAIHHSPNNPDFYSALGCAYADRAASISHALLFRMLLTQQQKQFPQDLEEWNDAQSNSSDPNFKTPKPVYPKNHTFVLKDDNRPFSMTDAMAGKQIYLLDIKAKKAWNRAVALCKNKRQKARLEYVEAWGLTQLFINRVDITGKPLNHLFQLGNNAEKEPIQLFLLAIKDNPNVPEYWQGLGDSIWLTHSGDFKGVPVIDTGDYWQSASRFIGLEDMNNAVDSNRLMACAYRKSLLLQPNNAPLWYRLARYYRDTDKDMALSCLQSYMQYDNINAIVHYETAALYFDNTHYGDVLNLSEGALNERIEDASVNTTLDMQKLGMKAIAEIKTANGLHNYTAPMYTMHIPVLMRSSQYYRDSYNRLYSMDFHLYSHCRNWARQAAGYVYISAYQNDTATALDAANAIIEMGDQMVNGWPTSDGGDTYKFIRALVGSAVLSIAYKSEEYAAELSNDTKLVNKAKEKSEDLKLKQDDYTKSIRKQMKNLIIADVY